MAPVRPLSVTDIVVASAAIFLVHRIVKHYRSRSNRGNATPLGGPPSNSRIFGLTKELQTSEDVGKIYEDWAVEYGSVYKIPTIFGREKIMILDPKAISHFYSKETFVYVGTPLQRKALTPAFSNAAIRRLTAVFYDSAYKVLSLNATNQSETDARLFLPPSESQLKTHWDAKLENYPDGDIIEVQEWMNHVALDSIGIAGFSHDFGSLDGKPSAVVDAFESLGQTPPSKLGLIIFLLSFVFPSLMSMPTRRNKRLMELKRSMGEIADELLERSRKGDLGADDKSIIGLLSEWCLPADEDISLPFRRAVVKAENTQQDGDLHMTPEEVLAQNVLLLAGYETTSISLTWALIELSKAPEKQDQLRKELLETKNGQDAEWDDLMAADKYPYLDAVVHEILRLHPPLVETNRVSSEPDVIPLSTPLLTKHGESVTSIAIPTGVHISAPISCMNRSELVWGKRAKDFIPERWIGEGEGEDVIPASAKEIQAYRHLLTFSDGPRTCLGKNFALAEFKSVLSVLIKNYRFEFPDGVDGKDTKIVTARGILPRPKVEGSVGPNIPLRVRRVE
ncbi:hypothetical protein PQX77_017824 [Marasmius sp. AFHP31]|nr:hypothetical protein PQX77_017824 [Marasmius sp. AFHP31]